MPLTQLVDVTLRDGLQNERTIFSLKDKYLLLKKLSVSGLKRIELGAFVSEKQVPQMANTLELTKKVLERQRRKLLPSSIAFSAFVPNQIGFNKAVECGLTEISTFISCTDSFSKKNIHISVRKSLKNLKEISRQARLLNINLRAYLSVCFQCPYEGRIPISRVVALADRIMQEGCFELSLSDTIGQAVFSDVEKLMNAIVKKIPIQNIALHFHDTKGMALANIVAGLNCGVRTFDSSAGGLGGCPYAKGSAGNVATEDVVFMLEKAGYKTGVNIQKLIQTAKFLRRKLHKSLFSKISSL